MFYKSLNRDTPPFSFNPTSAITGPSAQRPSDATSYGHGARTHKGPLRFDNSREKMQGRASAHPHHAYLPRPRTRPNRIQKENAFTTRTRRNNPQRVQATQRPTPRADMQGRTSVHPRHGYLPRPRASSNRQTDNTTTTHTNYHGHPQSTTDHLLPGKPQNNHQNNYHNNYHLQNNHPNNYHHQVHQRVGFARLNPSPVVKRGVDLDGDCQMTGMPFIYSKKDWFRIQREVRQLQIEEQQRIANDPDSSMTDAPNTVYRS